MSASIRTINAICEYATRLRDHLEDDGLIPEETRALENIEYCTQKLLLVASVTDNEGRGRAAVKLFHDAQGTLVASCQQHKHQQCQHMQQLMRDQEFALNAQGATAASTPAEPNAGGRNFTVHRATGPRTKSIRSAAKRIPLVVCPRVILTSCMFTTVTNSRILPNNIRTLLQGLWKT